MKPRDAARIAKQAGVMKCQPGDRFVSPRGEEFYVEPRVIMQGWHAYAFMLQDKPVGVLIFRRGTETRLRYCDLEGRVHTEAIRADSFEAQMMAAINRMSVLTKQFHGERNPLAKAVAANHLAV